MQCVADSDITLSVNQCLIHVHKTVFLHELFCHKLVVVHADFVTLLKTK